MNGTAFARQIFEKTSAPCLLLDAMIIELVCTEYIWRSLALAEKDALAIG